MSRAPSLFALQNRCCAEESCMLPVDADEDAFAFIAEVDEQAPTPRRSASGNGPANCSIRSAASGLRGRRHRNVSLLR